MDRLQRVAPGRKPFASQPGGVLPFFKHRRPFEGLQRQFAQGARGQAGRCGIDRFNQRDFRLALDGQQIVRMHDLGFDPEMLHLARDHAIGPRRVLTQQMRTAFEEDQRDKARVVEGADAIGQADPGGRLMGIDAHLEGLRFALAGRDRLGPGPEDHAVGQGEQQVAHKGPRRLFHQGRDLGSDAFQGRDRREQRKENSAGA